MRGIQRLFLILVTLAILAGLVLAAVGVISVQNTPDKTSITIDKTELKAKTKDAVEKTKEAGSSILEKTGESLHKAGKDIDESRDQSEPSKSPNFDKKDKPQPAANDMP
jgi:hypothetical protein